MLTFFIIVPTHASKRRLAYFQGLPENFMIFTMDVLKTSEFIENTGLLSFLKEM